MTVIRMAAPRRDRVEAVPVVLKNNLGLDSAFSRSNSSAAKQEEARPSNTQAKKMVFMVSIVNIKIDPFVRNYYTNYTNPLLN